MPLGAMLVGGGYTAPNPLKGFPDIFGYLPSGRAFVIEVKTETGKLSELQGQWLTRLQNTGVICIVARSLDDVKSLLGDYL